jgi:hypothetical protein
MSDGSPTPFHAVGTPRSKINVEISYQIIGLFSEGLYSSPNKAIEELVSNAFDADATCTHVVMTADRAAPDSSIAVLDNGTGMDEGGLRRHWVVGDSAKTENRTTAKGRRTIGRFGIGKLAAYVLGDRLTHVSKMDGRYFSTSMDFSSIPKTVDATDGDAREAREPVRLDLRELSEQEARHALRAWLPDGEGRVDLTLFGDGAEETWTVAIISDLKPMATDLSPGRLRWVLSTAMPLRDDFQLYLGNEKVASSKVRGNRVGHWVLGKEIKQLAKPGPQVVEAGTDSAYGAADYRHFTLTDPVLGPITGYVEGYESPIEGGKSEQIGRSNGFFVYVHGRLINPDDAGFGIDRNTLRHGTFSRFRAVVNINRLDEELRSSRESLRDGPRLIESRNLLQALFNFARSKLEAHDTSTSTERQATQRFADSPLSLTERPIVSLLLDAFEAELPTRHLSDVDRTQFSDVEAIRGYIEERTKDGAGLIAEITYADLGTHLPMAVLDVISGSLSVNLEHPFVAHFADEFGDKKKNLPLQLFAISEILLEAELHNSGVESATIDTVLDSRDELLRHLARSSGVESSLTVAHDLVNSASSVKGLEDAVVAAFNQLGYEAIPKAQKDEADGIAEAFLSGTPDGGSNHYRVSLEAKSKETVGAKVKKKDVQVSTIARHRDEASCEHAIVIGPAFETGPDNLGAVIREIDKDREANTESGKTITLMRIADHAKLVRIAPVKRLNLEQLRALFQARTPDEAAEFVAGLEEAKVDEAPFKAILDQVWDIQQADKEHTVEYSALRTALRMSGKLTITHNDLKTECAALSRMAPNLFFARDDRVELNIHPEKVLGVLHDYVERVPMDNAE